MNSETRSLNGYGNNKTNPTWGMAETQLLRLAPSAYADGISKLSGSERPNPRCISNIVLSQEKSVPNYKGASDYLWVWGQFIDHDIGITELADPEEPLPIIVPKGDPYFDVAHTGNQTIAFSRSAYDTNTTNPDAPREQINFQTSFLDASNVYGSSEERIENIRRNDGTGRLKTNHGGLLPYNNVGISNAPDNSSQYYLAGDIRANEQLLLLAIHTLWVREHNRLAHQFWINNPNWTDEQIFQETRKYVIAYNQSITYNEYLPLLLGDAVTSYNGYDTNTNPQIFNEFSAACYRLGHSQVSSVLLRLRSDLLPISEGHIRLRDAFFSPELLTIGGGIEPLLRGAAYQICQETDVRTVDELRNFLFGVPGQGGLDLAALNIQRGRDHGLPSYNKVREILGLTPKDSFEEVSSNEETVRRLKEAYSDLKNLDLWVGALAEDIVDGALVGELIQTICWKQFENIRNGDRFWYQKMFSGSELTEIENTKLSDIIRRNTIINNEIPDNVFIAGTL